MPVGTLRMGGFGGSAGLAAYLRANGTTLLVDATHPYAGIMSKHAVDASAETGVPLLRYMRPVWQAQPGQDWTIVETMAEAARVLPEGANVLVTSGHTGLETLVTRDDCTFVVRLIEAPDIDMPHTARVLLSRPPYTLPDEMALMERYGITHLVTKNSGGTQTSAKLEAAQRLGVKVIMLARPAYGAAREVDSVDAVVDAIAEMTP